MLKELCITVIFYAAVCLAIPVLDSHSPAVSEQKKLIRVKRFGFFGGYSSYLGNSPQSVSFKTPFFKVKVKNGFPGGYGYGYPPYQMHGPFSGGSYYPQPQPQGFFGAFHGPYDYQQYSHGYGWFG